MTTGDRRRRVVLLLAALSLPVAYGCSWLLADVLDPWNARTVDRFFQLRGRFERFRPPYNDVVVHLDLNDSSLRTLDNFYLNRADFARVIANLSKMGVSAQVYDMIFAARTDPEQDAALVEATRRAAHVYFGAAFQPSPVSGQPDGRSRQEIEYLQRTAWQVAVDGDAAQLTTGTKPLITFLDLATAARGIGALNVEPDRDGVYRRAPLLLRYGNTWYPSVALRVACDYLGVAPHDIEIVPGRAITLRNARWPHAAGTRSITIPIDRHGHAVLNFLGPWERMTHYSFGDIWEAADADAIDLWREELSGKIVLVSDVTTGSADVGPVPTDARMPLGAVHATLLHSILSASFVYDARPGVMLLLEILLIGLAAAAALSLGGRWFATATFALALMYITGAAAAFLWFGYMLQVVRPLLVLAIAGASIGSYRFIAEEKEKAALQRSFEAYFPPQLVRKILVNPALVQTSGEKKELTILFSDIQGFTTRSATMTPDDIQRFLNEYFDAMVEIVFRHDGTVDKFIGDGLMAFFGHPQERPDHALCATQAAIDMQAAVRSLNRVWEQRGQPSVRVRIGLNTGVVVVGNMGSARRLSYTVLGADVNLAQRLESNALPGGILVSRRTSALIAPEVRVRPRGEIDIKGLGPISVFDVVLPEHEASPRSIPAGETPPLIY